MATEEAYPHTRVLVVGAGMAGLSAALAALEAGASVVLLSRLPATRSASVAYRGTFNASSDPDVSGHIADALAAGGPSASEARLRARCEAAPGLLEWLAGHGVPFDRSRDGYQRHLLPGSAKARSLTAGAGLGRQIVHALDGRARRYELEGRLRRAPGWHLGDLVLDDQGTCRGALALNLYTHEVQTFMADSVVLATGGAGWLMRPSACSMESNGAAMGIAHRHGARLQDADLLAWSLAVPGPDKDLALSPLLVAQGAKLQGGAVDLRGLSKQDLKRWGGSFPRLAAAFSGRNPAGELIPLRASVCGNLGGLRVDAAMGTDIPGLYAAGEAACGGFGSHVLGGDEALDWIHGGCMAGRKAAENTSGTDHAASAARVKLAFEHRQKALHSRHGTVSPSTLGGALTEVLASALGGVGSDTGPEALNTLAHRAEAELWVKDKNEIANAAIVAALDFEASLAWARSAVTTAEARAKALKAQESGAATETFIATWNESGTANISRESAR